MGKVRPVHVKRIARELLERFPDEFTTDFDTNKKLVEELTVGSSKKLRNRVAGYIIRLIDLKKER
jgi:small subunit ribosomal protein S17e